MAHQTNQKPFVVAGLKPIKPGEEPTLRYQRLLPFYVLGGMAGLRRREMISSDPGPDGIGKKA
jgi:hypothetical protein